MLIRNEDSIGCIANNATENRAIMSTWKRGLEKELCVFRYMAGGRWRQQNKTERGWR